MSEDGDSEELCLPKFLPLTAFQIGKWYSRLHIQLFFHVCDQGPASERKFVFLITYPEERKRGDYRQLFLEAIAKSSPFVSLRQRKERPAPQPSSPSPSKSMRSQIAKIFTQETLDTAFEMVRGNFWGVIAFELYWKDILGFDYINRLTHDGGRCVFEARSMKKIWFPSLQGFHNHYKLDSDLSSGTYYRPTPNRSFSRYVTKQMLPPHRHFGELYGATSPMHTTSSGYDTDMSLGEGRSAANSISSETFDEDLEERVLQNQTVVFYFDDPFLPYVIRNVIHQADQQRLLRLYESGLPSWAVFLPSYGLFYRRWLRTVVTILMFFVSLVSMVIGFYDLYKHVPIIRNMMRGALGPFGAWFDSQINLRLSLLLSYLLPQTRFFQELRTLVSPLFQGVITWIFSPFLSLIMYISAPIFSVIQVILSPFQALIMFILTMLQEIVMAFLPIFRALRSVLSHFGRLLILIKDSVVTVVWGLPLYLLGSVYMILKESILLLYRTMTDLAYFLSPFKKAFSSAAVASESTVVTTATTTSTFRRMFSAGKDLWDTFIRNLWRAFKSAIDGISIIAVKINSHRWSLQHQFEDLWRRTIVPSWQKFYARWIDPYLGHMFIFTLASIFSAVLISKLLMP